MTFEQNKKNIIVCCERMLMEIGVTILLDSIQWPHLRSASTGPSLDCCPWCGAKMPFQSEVKP